MSFVVTIPEALAAVATDLAGIGSTIGTANAAAAVPTTTVLAAAADEVSAAMAALFSGHAQAYQALSAQAALFHEQFVRALTAGAGSAAASPRRPVPHIAMTDWSSRRAVTWSNPRCQDWQSSVLMSTRTTARSGYSSICKDWPAGR